MNKSTCLFLLCLLWKIHSVAQFNQWAWIKGDSAKNATAVYGTQGIPSPANTPAPFYESCEWTDKQGNLWIYGGNGTFKASTLWRFDVTTHNWTWIKGVGAASYDAISYGTKGVSSPTNTPGPRIFGVPTWVDTSGNFWLFGGADTAIFNIRCDLWKYSITTNEWTWVNGPNMINQPGVYGIKGVPNPANHPGARFETSCTWVDNDNNLWLYGGTGRDKNGTDGFLGDLWKYNISTNEWTWMHGSDVVSVSPVYGTKGVAATTNTPGSRLVYSRWKDVNGRLWLMGGQLHTNNDFSNDLWMYDPAGNTWTWMNGSKTPHSNGSSGPLCVPGANFSPAARKESRACWTDACGNFWLQGGWRGYSDLWSYNTKTNQWKLVKGTTLLDQKPVWGIKGNPSSTTLPGNTAGSTAGVDKSYNLWMFGGYNDKSINNNILWRYTPDTVTAGFSFVQAPGSCAQPPVVHFTNESNTNCNEIKSYFWHFDDLSSGASNTSTLENPSHQYTTSGDYQVKLIITSCSMGKDSIAHTITVNSSASFSATVTPTAVNCFGGTNGAAAVTTTGTSTLFTYSWNNGQTNATATNLQAGVFTVTITDAANCSVTQTVTVTEPVAITTSINTKNATCNETNGQARVITSGGTLGYTYSWNTGSTIDSITGVPAGIYTVEIRDANNCTKTATAVIANADGPVVAPMIIPVTCNGQNNGSAIVSVNGGVSPITYLWNTGNTTDRIENSIAGTYTVTVTDNNNCKSTVTAQITEPIAISVTTIAKPTFCGKDNGYAVAEAMGGIPGYTYTWNSGIINNSIITLSAGTYTVTVKDANNCTATRSVDILPSSDINGSIIQRNEKCEGDKDGMAALLVSGGVNPYTYTWNTNPVQTNDTIVGLSAGTYTVAYSDAAGCSKTSSVQIIANPLPVASAGADVIITSGTSVQLNGAGGGTYSWSPLGSLSCIDCPNPLAHPLISTVYTLTVTDPNGCMDSDELTITVTDTLKIKCGELIIPTAFSPNGDGMNDVFRVRANCVVTFNLAIFDRWGEKVFETTDASIGWNGIYRNQTMNASVLAYYLEVTFTNGQKIMKQGNLTLLR